MIVGEMHIDQVWDGTVLVSAVERYGRLGQVKGARIDDWGPYRQFLESGNRLRLDNGAFLLRGGPLRERIVLVDAGTGPKSAGIFPRGVLLKSLAAFGIAPKDVTDVVFTHLHLDHVGWASIEGSPVFLNATYRCATDEWDHFFNRPPLAKHYADTTDLLGPIRDRFETFDTSCGILPGIHCELTPGHTPGGTVVVLSHRNDRAILLGDVAHSPVELVDNDWAGLGDVDPPLAKRARVALAEMLKREGIPFAAAHFPGLDFGRLVPDGDGWTWARD